MTHLPPKSYKESGVDTAKAQKLIYKNKKKIHSTFSSLVYSHLGGFSGGFDVSFLKKYKNPILVSGTDGVGTKIEFARIFQNYKTIGIDLVAMCVNDILVNGAMPLYFLDYIACEKLEENIFDQIISGIIEGCKQSNISLIGGETAEHPNLMKKKHYDLAGFSVGVVEKEKIIDGSKIQDGDKIIGIASNGLHSNGFSWIRKIFLDDNSNIKNTNLKHINWLKEHCLKPTRIYTNSILNLISEIKVKGLVHITGGGFFENIPRILPKKFSAKIYKKNIPQSDFFDRLKKDYSLNELELFSTFNMGVGFMVIISKEEKEKCLHTLNQNQETAFELGTVNFLEKIKIKII